VSHVISDGFGGRGAIGSLALPSKELGEQSGVKVADLAATIPQEGKLFAGLAPCLGQIIRRAEDTLTAPAAVPFPASVRPLPKAAGEPANSDNLMLHG
jgi:hypothetical protein